MRKVILMAGVSLDGYIARLDGSVGFLGTPDSSPGAQEAMVEIFAQIDVVLFGRKTFDAAKAYGEPPRGSWTTYVFSNSQPPGEREGVIFVDQSPAAFIAKLRESPGKNILHMGGGKLARSFLADDLIDELQLGIVPVLLGEGIPLFPSGFPQRDFAPVEHASGPAAARYRRLR